MQDAVCIDVCVCGGEAVQIVLHIMSLLSGIFELDIKVEDQKESALCRSVFESRVKILR